MPGIYKMFCSRLLCEWIALVFLCHVVGLTLCVGVTPLGLERMLALFGQSYAKEQCRCDLLYQSYESV